MAGHDAIEPGSQRNRVAPVQQPEHGLQPVVADGAAADEVAGGEGDGSLAQWKALAQELGVDAVFDKSNEIDALVDYCTQQSAAA